MPFIPMQCGHTLLDASYTDFLSPYSFYNLRSQQENALRSVCISSILYTWWRHYDAVVNPHHNFPLTPA